MKNFRFVAFVAFAAAAVLGRAQTTYTNLGDGGGPALVTTSGWTAVQTFTGFESLSSATWTLTNSVGGSGQSTTFNAYVAQWDALNNRAMVGTLQQYGGGSAVLTGIDLFDTGEVTFSQNLSLTSSATYALILSYASGDAAFGVTWDTSPADAFFGSGARGMASTSSDLGGFQAYLESTGASMTPGESYTMSVTGIAATPAPEPATAAAVIAAVFIAGLAGRRVWQRRKLATEPLAA
jgi:hypothetical protein